MPIPQYINLSLVEMLSWMRGKKKAPKPKPPPPPDVLSKAMASVDLETLARRHRRRHLARKYGVRWLDFAGISSSINARRGATEYRVGVEYHKSKAYSKLPLGVAGGSPRRSKVSCFVAISGAPFSGLTTLPRTRPPLPPPLPGRHNPNHQHYPAQ